MLKVAWAALILLWLVCGACQTSTRAWDAFKWLLLVSRQVAGCNSPHDWLISWPCFMQYVEVKMVPMDVIWMVLVKRKQLHVNRSCIVCCCTCGGIYRMDWFCYLIVSTWWLGHCLVFPPCLTVANCIWVYISITIVGELCLAGLSDRYWSMLYI